MPYRLKFSKRYDKDVAAVEDYYEQEQTGLSLYFYEKLDEALDKLERKPFAFAAVPKTTLRRVVLHKFPYALYYRIRGRRVLVTRCYSTHRKPLY